MQCKPRSVPCSQHESLRFHGRPGSPSRPLRPCARSPAPQTGVPAGGGAVMGPDNACGTSAVNETDVRIKWGQAHAPRLTEPSPGSSGIHAELGPYGSVPGSLAVARRAVARALDCGWT